MNILRFSVGSEAKRVAVRCVFAIGVVCWANFVFYNCFLDFGFVGGVSTVKLSTNCSLNEPM